MTQSVSYQQRQHLIRLLGRPPVVTYTLILVFCGVYGALLLLEQQLVGSFSTRPSFSLLHGATWAGRVRESGEYYRLVSAIFVHANLMHLLFNGYGIYILGPALEKFFGWQKYLVLFVVSGLGGTLATYVANAEQGTPSVGASGAIFGILAATGVLGLKYRRSLPRAIARQMVRGALILFVANMAIGFMVPNIDMAAHLGGAIAGAVIALVMPADIAVTRPNRVLRLLAAALAIVVAGWGLFEMWGVTSRCGDTEDAFISCYERELAAMQSRVMEQGDSSTIE